MTSLRFRIAALVAAAVIPVTGLVAYSLTQLDSVLEDDKLRETLTTARLVSDQLLQMLQGAQQLMFAVSQNSAIQHSFTKDCANYLGPLITKIPLYEAAAIADTQGKVWCSASALSRDESLAKHFAFREAISTDGLAIGNLVRGMSDNKSTLNLALPYHDPQGELLGVVMLSLNLQHLSALLEQRYLRDDEVISILDRNGERVLRLPDHGSTATPKLPAALFKKMESAFFRGVTEAQSESGIPRIIGFTSLPDLSHRLVVAVEIKRDAALAEGRQIVWNSSFLTLAIFMIAIGGAWAVGNLTLRKPILALVETAQLRESGKRDVVFPFLGARSELGQLSFALNSMSQSLNRLLDDKDMLLQEVQHRIMNSLQILSGLLASQARKINDPTARAQVALAHDRLHSMGLLYRRLYKTDSAGTVDFGAYLREFCSEVGKAYYGDIPQIECTTDEVIVSMDVALKLSLIVHELVVNAFKYAYEPGELGPIHLVMKRSENGGYDLRVIDFGHGLPEKFGFDERNGLGMTLVNRTTQELGGTLTFGTPPVGCEFIIKLPALVCAA